MVRDLWSEVKKARSEDMRRMIGTASRAVYILFIVLGGIVSVDLYTRPDALLLRIFGVGAALGLVVSDALVAWATHYSAKGPQRWIARGFWIVSLAIFGMNIVADYQFHIFGELAGESPIIRFWYYTGSLLTVIVSAVGWSLYSMFSPEQALVDAEAQAKADAVSAMLRGITDMSPEVRGIFNARIGPAVEALADHAGNVVAGYVEGLTSASKPTLPSPPPARVVAMNAESPGLPESTRRRVNGREPSPTPPSVPHGQ